MSPSHKLPIVILVAIVVYVTIVLVGFVATAISHGLLETLLSLAGLEGISEL